MTRKKILIVDDTKDILESVSEILKGTGLYEIRTEPSSPRALSVLKEFKPDLLLLDIVMPIVDGPELASQIAADPAGKGVRIVFMTSLVTAEETQIQNGRIGGYPFIAKPVTATELIRRVREALEA
jgi:CheY-like chemotaxis protein